MTTESAPLPSNSSADQLYIPQRTADDKHRTLILLLDGTGDKEDADVTNVILLRDMLYGWGEQTKNTEKQLVYYQQGIGTYFPRFKDTDIYIPIVSPASRTVDSAIAWSLPYHVTDAYQWLVQNYQPGDKISLFGFSRGAYTARVIAGMLNAVALLPLAHINKVQDAYQLFDRQLPKERFRDDPITKEAWDKLIADFTAFKKKYDCLTVTIDFLGCWDTVNSVGVIRPIKLRYTANNDIVRVFRHALALDEHRVRFKQNMWGKAKPPGAPGIAPRIVTDVQEVWFAGCHCDIGGGSVPNDTRPNLAHISLRWMIRECFKTNTSILLNANLIQTIGINPSHLYPQVLPRPDALPAPSGATIPPPNVPGFAKRWGSWLYSWIPFTSTPPPKFLAAPHPEVTEEQHDLLDCLAPAYDQLDLKPLRWRAMEYTPLITSVYQPKAVYPEPLFKEERVAHKGVGRTIPPPEATRGNKIKVHRTVKTRLQAIMEEGELKGKPYSPRARVGYETRQDFGLANVETFEWVG